MVTERPICEGDFVCHYDGKITPKSEVNSMTKAKAAICSFLNIMGGNFGSSYKFNWTGNQRPQRTNQPTPPPLPKIHLYNLANQEKKTPASNPKGKPSQKKAQQTLRYPSLKQPLPKIISPHLHLLISHSMQVKSHQSLDQSMHSTRRSRL